MFHVSDIPGKGKGVLAARDIKNLDPKEHVDRLALAIFETNAVSAGKDTVGIFPTMARLNHGCSSAFNVVYSWRNEHEGLFVHALKDIKKGQELLTTYTDTKRPREERRKLIPEDRAYLTQQYGFKCTCDVCALPDGLSQASDRRLSKISELYRKFATWGNMDIDGIQAINYVREIWEIEDEEGYWSERGQLAADAAWVAASHSDASAAQAWALKAAEWFTYEIGADTPQVRSLITVGDRPQSHNAWGTREKLEVGGPKY
uniref:SET domain-containing protein n=1 Tax=Psilocybe cubensis TaxID=181762 RepID=A0A8H8CH42_PSICU